MASPERIGLNTRITIKTWWIEPPNFVSPTPPKFGKKIGNMMGLGKCITGFKYVIILGIYFNTNFKGVSEWLSIFPLSVQSSKYHDEVFGMYNWCIRPESTNLGKLASIVFGEPRPNNGQTTGARGILYLQSIPFRVDLNFDKHLSWSNSHHQEKNPRSLTFYWNTGCLMTGSENFISLWNTPHICGWFVIR